MIIFNTTYCVSDKVYESFIKWIKAVHLPKMAEEQFYDPVVSKIINAQPDQVGSSISVLFRVKSLYDIDLWNNNAGNLYRKELKRIFGEEVLLFETFMEEI